MKIVYCTDSICYAGGIQRITVAKANALAEISENEVWIIVTDNKKQPVLPVSEKVKLIDLDVNYFEDDWKSNWHTLKGIIVKRRLHKKRLARVLKQINPDIVISTGTAEKNFLCTIQLPVKPKFIREIHNVKNYRSLAASSKFDKIMAFWGDKRDYGFAINRYDKIVILTHEDKELNWNNNDKVVIISNPLTEKTDKKSTLTNKTVITAGRYTHAKNHQSLIKAWSFVHNQFPDWHLEIWGDGVLRNQNQQLIDDLQLSEVVHLKGYTYSIIEEMQKASIYVCSSHFEGFSLVFIEAMTCNLPVVTYACPCGPKDVISEGIDGFLVERGNESELAHKIMCLMKDDELRRKMGEAAGLKADLYSMDKVIGSWMTLFKNVLKL